MYSHIYWHYSEDSKRNIYEQQQVALISQSLARCKSRCQMKIFTGYVGKTREATTVKECDFCDNHCMPASMNYLYFIGENFPLQEL